MVDQEGGLVDHQKDRPDPTTRSELSWIRTSIVIDRKNITKWETFANGQYEPSAVAPVRAGHVSRSRSSAAQSSGPGAPG